ncbi:tRNA (adenosine(37)-N6)-threonylcarbamoyltransferase complex ATPase subunit type 1 TsaE [Arcticibacter sp. MXS-1]|uniref:tRNA (adenosine(37)-N6)-threonylcarbamoyltransferase complex ATPase subunit type 1 TsaE n=1 Tax=Arcticibacter sp. MXS-1 TaxID=3341726 RepID=UPI0035A85741
MELRISHLGELPAVARELILFAGDARVFLFYGEMGAGKTTLIKQLCALLGSEDTASSPTFSIVNEYKSGGGVIFHFDFYRLKDESEAMDLGYEDYFYSGNYCFVEWPEKIPNLLPESYVEVAITVDFGLTRIVRVDRVGI